MDNSKPIDGAIKMSGGFPLDCEQLSASTSTSCKHAGFTGVTLTTTTTSPVVFGQATNQSSDLCVQRMKVEMGAEMEAKNRELQAVAEQDQARQRVPISSHMSHLVSQLGERNRALGQAHEANDALNSKSQRLENSVKRLMAQLQREQATVRSMPKLIAKAVDIESRQAREEKDRLQNANVELQERKRALAGDNERLRLEKKEFAAKATKRKVEVNRLIDAKEKSEKALEEKSQAEMAASQEQIQALEQDVGKQANRSKKFENLHMQLLMDHRDSDKQAARLNRDAHSLRTSLMARDEQLQRSQADKAALKARLDNLAQLYNDSLRLAKQYASELKKVDADWKAHLNKRAKQHAGELKQSRADNTALKNRLDNSTKEHSEKLASLSADVESHCDQLRKSKAEIAGMTATQKTQTAQTAELEASRETWMFMAQEDERKLAAFDGHLTQLAKQEIDKDDAMEQKLASTEQSLLTAEKKLAQRTKQLTDQDAMMVEHGRQITMMHLVEERDRLLELREKEQEAARQRALGSEDEITGKYDKTSTLKNSQHEQMAANSKIDRLNEGHRMLKGINNSLANEVAALDAKLADARRCIEALQGELERGEEAASEAITNKGMAIAGLEGLLKDESRLVFEQENTIRDFGKDKAELSKRIDTAIGLLEMKTEDVLAREAEIVELKAAIGGEIADLEASRDAEVADLRAAMDAEIKDHKAAKAEVESDMAKMQANLSRGIHNNVLEARVLKTEIAAKDNTLAELKNELRNSQQEVQMRADGGLRMARRLTEYMAQINVLKKEVAAKDNKLAEMAAKALEKASQVDDLAFLNEQLGKKIEFFNTAVSQLKKDKAALEKVVASQMTASETQVACWNKSAKEHAGDIMHHQTELKRAHKQKEHALVFQALQYRDQVAKLEALAAARGRAVEVAQRAMGQKAQTARALERRVAELQEAKTNLTRDNVFFHARVEDLAQTNRRSGETLSERSRELALQRQIVKTLTGEFEGQCGLVRTQHAAIRRLEEEKEALENENAALKDEFHIVEPLSGDDFEGQNRISESQKHAVVQQVQENSLSGSSSFVMPRHERIPAGLADSVMMEADEAEAEEWDDAYEDSDSQESYELGFSVASVVSALSCTSIVSDRA